MRTSPWWTRASGLGAPLFLIGGFCLAARLQPPAYDWRTDTISALAAHGARERWLMTAAFYGLGVCHMLTALGLREAHAKARWILALGGAAVVMVAVFPASPGRQGLLHDTFAGIAFLALAVWPAFSLAHQPWAMRPRIALSAVAVLLLLLSWFLLTLRGIGAIGIAEHTVASAEALWPWCVVESVRIGICVYESERA